MGPTATQAEEYELGIPLTTTAPPSGKDIQNGTNGHLSEADDEKDGNRKDKGLTLVTAAIFILGEMAGSGVLALPNAVLGAGWAGLVMIAVFCATSAYSGTRLGNCWIMLEERYAEYRKEVRNPYPSIALKAYGRWAKILVSACVNITLFGVGTVFLLLSSKLVGSVIEHLYPMSTCFWILIIAVVLTPFMWLGTPKDFWPIAIGAAVSTAIACVMVIVRSGIDVSNRQPEVEIEYPLPTFSSFFLAFGTILFSYGGASTFPTIQNDMRDRRHFSKSVAFAFIGLAVLYLPVAGVGYGLFGHLVQANILDTLEKGVDIIIVEVLMAAHLFFAFVIIINPFCQEFEILCKVPNAFGWKRCLLRTLIMVMIVFVGETVPFFGKILNLVGGSTITALTFIFPPLFYMKLVDDKQANWPERTIGIYERIFLWSLIVVGVIGGCAGTYNAVQAIAAPDAFSLPCYLR